MRKEIDITIEAEGRDRGKVFCLREMAAMAAEKWAMRAAIALSDALPHLDPLMGVAGFRQILGDVPMLLRSLGKLDFDKAEPLLDEMMSCISVRPTPGNLAIIRPLLEEDVEEIATLFKLRVEVIKLHLGF